MARHKSKCSRIAIPILVNAVIVFSVLLFTPGLPPNIRFESYKLKPPHELAGVLAPNKILDKAELLIEGKFTGPESIAIRGSEIFTGVKGGRILRIKDGKISTVIQTGHCDDGREWDEINCGRPLGMRFDSKGKLIVADAYKGIFRLDVDTGKQETLVSTSVEIDGKRPGLPDDLDISKDGVIYWSDASTECNLHDATIEFFGGPSGRVLRYDPISNSSTVLVSGIHFPNGIQLGKNEEWFLYAESMRARVWRYWLKGPKAGTKEILLDGLPGVPDNIRPNGKGGYFITLGGFRDSKNPSPADVLGAMPLIRKLMLRIQGLALFFIGKLDSVDIFNKAKYYVGKFGPLGDPSSLPFWSKKLVVIEINENGEIIGSLQGEGEHGSMELLSEVSVGKEYTYFGSYFESKLWRMKTSDLRN